LLTRTITGNGCGSALVLLGLLLLGVSCSSDIPEKPVRLATLVGTIRDPDGTPISKVIVSLGGSHGYSNTITDTTGSYRTTLPEGVYEMYLRSRFDASQSVPEIEMAGIRIQAPTTRFDYQYRGFPVTGHVFGPLGSALDSVWISVYDRETEFYTRVLTGGQGYRLFLPKAGRYSGSVQPARRYSGIPSLFFTDLAVARDTILDFRLEGNAVTGTVSLGSTVPVEAYVYASGTRNAEARTESDGTFVIYLPTGHYDWHIDPIGGSDYIYPLYEAGPDVAGPATVDFDLSGTHWSGTVRDSASGAPIESVSVEAWLGSGERATNVTDATGRYELILRSYLRYNISLGPPNPSLRGIPVYGLLAAGDSTIDLYMAPASSARWFPLGWMPTPKRPEARTAGARAPDGPGRGRRTPRTAE